MKFGYSLKNMRVFSTLSLFAGCLVLTGLLIVSQWHVEHGMRSIQDIRRHDSQLQKLEQLLNRLVDAETGARGYLLTQDPAYLQPYTDARKVLPALVQDLQQGLETSPAPGVSFLALKHNIDQKLDWLQRNVQAGRLGVVAEPDGKPKFGKRSMDSIRAQIGLIRQHWILQNQHALMRAQAKLHWLQWTVSLLALVGMGVMLAGYLSLQRQADIRHRLAERLRHKNSWLEAKVAERTSELSDLASYLTNARETERARIARELHDELGSLLTAARMDASWLSKRLGDAGEDVRIRLKRLMEAIGNGITIKRRVVESLRPALLQGLGLGEALSALADDLALTTSVSLSLPADLPRFSEDQSLAVFRIVQEAFTNIRKYAQARTVRVALAIEDNRMRLCIQDDGIGFDTRSPKFHRHGLAGMQHRVQMFQGELILLSAPGKGACITVYMPIVSDDAQKG